MTGSTLLDTNSLLWFSNRSLIRPEVYGLLDAARQRQSLIASSISIWELTFAARKRHLPSRPDLRGLTPRAWFEQAVRASHIQVLPITTDIAAEAAEIAVEYGSGDPGDCLLIATAHLHSLTLVTRDKRILDFANNNPVYLSAVRC